MRLLIFIQSLGGGGAERVTTNLANHWAAKGWEVTIVTLTPQDNDFYELRPAVRRIALKLAGDSGNTLVGLAQNLRRVFALRRVLRQTEPDIALGMMTEANVLLALAAWWLPQVYAIGSERTYPPQNPLGFFWEGLRRLSYGHLAVVTALTRESAYWLKSHTSVRRISVIPNAVLWPFPIHTPRIAPESICQPNRSIVLAVGRASEEKQFDVLLGVFHSLANQHPNWDLVILGDGPQWLALQAQVLTAGLEKRVFLPGKVGNVSEWYERADLYVMSSRFEGFPNTLVEAMAHGLGAVSFDCDTGPRDIIRHGLDGLLIPQGDMAGLAAALDWLMSDTASRQQFAKRAVEIRERFSMERIVGMWEELFDEVRK